MNTNTITPPPVAPVRRYRRGSDAWGRDSYAIPALAIAGASDTGEWVDSVAPSHTVKEELGALRKFLATQGIKTRTALSRSGNCCCLKRWVLAKRQDFARAFPLAEDWLNNNKNTTQFAHDARS
jgi:hypothetical protein